MKLLAKLGLHGVAAMAVTTLLPTTWAGGISLYEIATPDVGLASVGYAARADDASTLFKNPAGMSRLEGAQFQGGLQALYGSVAFDSSAVEDEQRTVTLPMGQTWRFGLGAQYQLSQKLNVGAAYTFMWAGDMSVDQGTDLSLRGRVSGAYEQAWFSVVALNLTWQF